MVQIEVLFLFKNIHIWPSYGQKLTTHALIWAYFFWQQLGHFWANWAEIVYGSSGDHYLSIGDKIQVISFFFIFIFCTTTRVPSGQEPPNSTKKLV